MKWNSSAGRVMSTKNSSDTIGNRNRDLQTCSAMPRPTAPPSTPIQYLGITEILNSNDNRLKAFDAI
jgi:hypothetical protein